jgi:hypothetical protein
MAKNVSAFFLSNLKINKFFKTRKKLFKNTKNINFFSYSPFTSYYGSLYGSGYSNYGGYSNGGYSNYGGYSNGGYSGTI